MKRIALILLLLALSADFGFGDVTFSPVTLAFPQIAIGGDAGGQNYVTLIQIVNNNSSFTDAHLTLFSDSGVALPALFDEQGPQSSMDIRLNSGQARQIQLTLKGPITVGWMQITYTPSDAQTTVILQFRSGTTLLSEVGVQPAFGSMAATDFAAETDATLNTGVAIANPSTVTMNVLVTLWDPATGLGLSGVAISLPPNGHIARLLTELFPTAPNITQIRTKVSLDACTDASCSFLDTSPTRFIGIATALRLNGGQFTTIPVADRPDGGDSSRILPQVAFGGPAGGLNMKTILYFTTNVATGVFGTVEIFDDDGNPLAASTDGAAMSTSANFGVPGNRVSRIVLSGDQTLRSGWVHLTLLSGAVHLIASAVFQTFNGSDLVSEASVLESAPVTRSLIYVKAQADLANVGVAFANSQPTANIITLQLFNRDGFVIGTRDITLPPNGHLAQFVTQIFPQVAPVPDFDGALFIRSATAFSALALRLSGDKIATLPVALDGMYRPSITSLRVTTTLRSPAQVNFAADVTDYDSDLAISSATAVAGIAQVDFGSVGYDFGPISLDGTGFLNRQNGTINGSFQLPHVAAGAIPANQPAVLSIILYDSAGNDSNVVSIPIKF